MNLAETTLYILAMIISIPTMPIAAVMVYKGEKLAFHIPMLVISLLGFIFSYYLLSKIKINTKD